ncbi:GDSL-type esterase/lipase family protein [Flammeovirga agarivorans]|uniref:SGNH hydrolase-type esterase domain-containing protein n=1 Tax=Flammeovirga agarivorans TaxID=2726742 RepID=A0A7X8XXG3_9BACT|nr:GDSL-type esterase/lipase family protein [Flammeovirga agarivorans]NLR93065.1 hypothetical protein [Flammeovirga agarivorans]
MLKPNKYSYCKHRGLWFIKGLLTVVLLCAHTAPTSTENVRRPFVAYDFIRMDLNKLQSFGDTTLYSFYKKLERLEEKKAGQVHIFHLGDSHIQADFFSGWVRERFYEDPRFDMSGRGFFFPYKAAKTNNPYSYKVNKIGSWKGQRASISYHKSNWGLAGITASTTESFASLTVDFSGNEAYSYRGNIVQVFYDVNDGTQFKPTIQPLNPASLEKVELFNDHISYVFDRPISKFRLGLKKEKDSAMRFDLKGFGVLNNKAPGIVYSSSGVNGAKVTSYLRCKTIKEDLAEVKPDMMVISLGTNDAFVAPFKPQRFYENYKKLIQLIRENQPDLPIILTTPGDNFRNSRYLNKDNARAIEMMYKLAQEEHLTIWDFYHVMGGLSSIEKWNELSMTSKDRVHLSRLGYQYQGELFYRALITNYDRFKTSH